MSGKKIPFSIPEIGDEEIREVLDTLKSGWLTTGPKSHEFEQKLKKFNNVKHAFAVNSCTSALHLSLAAAGIKKGDEVITTPFTFCSTVNSILYQQASPVLADIDKKTFNISPKKIEEKITEKTKAIIPVHFAGQPCDMDRIMEIAEKRNLIVVEDAAHAIGAEYKGKKAGSIGDFGCYSFYPIKNMTTGEGGAVVTNNDAYSEKLSVLRYLGINKDAWKRYHEKGSWYYEIIDLGFKYNMPDLLASLGLHQLDKLPNFIETRTKIVAMYNKAFSDIEEITLPYLEKNIKHAWHLYPILVDIQKLRITRNEFIEKLKDVGVGTAVNFIPIHYHPYYSKFGYKKGQFSESEFVFDRIISLPLYTTMSNSDVEYVIEKVIEIVQNNKQGMVL